MAIYKIQQGDTLSGIAKKYGTTVDAIAAANGISNVNKIYAGNNLNIPGAGGTSTPSAGTTQVSSGFTSMSSAPTYSESSKTKEAYKQWKNAEAAKPGDYTESQQLTDLRAQLEAMQGKKPGAYESAYQTQIDDLLNQILNRGSFEYDASNDKLYQAMADQYKVKGQQAMRDTMGNAAALTGGYGNSYAVTAGSQAYDQQMQQWRDMLPQFYQMALQKYQLEGDQLNSKLGALQDADDTAYGRYRDDVSDWRSDRDYLYGQVQDQYDTEYGQYRDSMSDYMNNMNYYLSKYGQLSGEDFERYQSALAQYNEDRAYEAAQAKAAASASSGGSRSGSGRSSQKATEETIMPKSSDQTTLFKGSIKTKHEFARTGDGGSYADYVDSVIEKWYDRGDLSKSDVAWLIDYYGL